MSSESTSKLGFRQIAEKLKNEIETNHLSYGAPLLPSRVFAEKLGVSRDTIVKAYRDLENRGYIETDGRRGTFVSFENKNESSNSNTALSEPKLSKLGQNIDVLAKAQIKSQETLENFALFNFGAVPKEALPLRQWRELLLKHVHSLKARNLDYTPDVFGQNVFRESLSKHLAHSEGLVCDKNDLAVFNISISAVEIIVNLLLDEGDCLAVENPGYPTILQLSQKHHFTLAYLPVDEKGADTEFLHHLHPKPKLIYLTPRSHDPTGATLSLERRMQVLAWANANNAWIIEDDFDRFFRYGETAPPSLKSLDSEGRVFYISTFWQALYPLATTSFLAMPSNFRELVRTSKALTDGVAEILPQLVIADLLDSGYLNGHIRKWNKVFAARRRSLMFNFARLFGKEAILPMYSAGLQCLVNLPNYERIAIMKAAKEASLPLREFEQQYHSERKNRYICNFASMEEPIIERRVQEFASLLSREI